MTLAFPEPSGSFPDNAHSIRHSHHRHVPLQPAAAVAHETFDTVLRARSSLHHDPMEGSRQPAITCATR
jgi:hypothetical protein